MSSSKGKSRQRQLARAKYERQLARRAALSRRRRQLLAGLGVLALVLIGFAVAFWLGAFDSDASGADPEPKPSMSSGDSQQPSSDTGSGEEKDGQ